MSLIKKYQIKKPSVQPITGWTVSRNGRTESQHTTIEAAEEAANRIFVKEVMDNFCEDDNFAMSAFLEEVVSETEFSLALLELVQAQINKR